MSFPPLIYALIGTGIHPVLSYTGLSVPEHADYMSI